MVWKILSALILAGALLSPAHGQTLLMPLAQQAVGVWADENGDSNIKIAPCGQALCGNVVWLKAPTDDTGRPKTDINNPDETLRVRPVLGLKIIAGLMFDPDNSSLKGKVYNADDGKVYDLYLKPKGQVMEVEGCLLQILCDTQTWTRVR
ncbi:MAG: DUF2147 domain-containing protein [Alphaproteobacteria bacterium]|nr:DUF2147 domain-containing protein [Alphaproteobacteria bacterium]